MKQIKNFILVLHFNVMITFPRRHASIVTPFIWAEHLTTYLCMNPLTSAHINDLHYHLVHHATALEDCDTNRFYKFELCHIFLRKNYHIQKPLKCFKNNFIAFHWTLNGMKGS